MTIFEDERVAKKRKKKKKKNLMIACCWPACSPAQTSISLRFMGLPMRHYTFDTKQAYAH